jgi:hypothetical protein
MRPKDRGIEAGGSGIDLDDVANCPRYEAAGTASR